MTILQFPDTTNRLYTWAKQYIIKYRRLGDKVASKYLHNAVPSQLHEQILNLSKTVLKKRKQ